MSQREALENNIYTQIETYMINKYNLYIGETEDLRFRITQLVDLVQLGDTVNRCLECNVDMGINNPRQYCAKTHCANVQPS